MHNRKACKHAHCRFVWMSLALLLLLGRAVGALADYKDDIGYTLLASELGSQVPNGAGVYVTQMEASDSNGYWMPDPAQFPGKTLTPKNPGVTTPSGHATTVGQYFYGASAMANGATEIDCYNVNYWIGSSFLRTTDSSQPAYRYSAPRIWASPSRVANHSWVGYGAYDSDILRRLDFVVETDEFIQVVAMNLNSTNRALLGTSFNAIAVGGTKGAHAMGSVALDSDYAAGRTRPDLVSPLSPTSYSTPLVAAAAAMLVETGREETLSLDPPALLPVDRGSGRYILNAERSEVIKAALMAGADRVTYNAADNITNYRMATGDRTANGLDRRFGAGQLNIRNSYHILAAGEQNGYGAAHDTDPGGQGSIGWSGFDYDPSFGVDGDNPCASYHFTADANHLRLYAALVWNLDVHGGTVLSFNPAVTLNDLDLRLWGQTANGWMEVATSTSTTDNTENLWASLVSGRHYVIEVKPKDGVVFDWDYALAWRITTPPDSDLDGIPDDWEVEQGFNYTDSGDGQNDGEPDGLTNLLEYQLGTDPYASDTDDDGHTDGAEYHAGSDPLDPLDFPEPVAVPALSRLALAGAGLFMISLACRRIYPKSL